MATYEITTPDGQVYEITEPDSPPAAPASSLPNTSPPTATAGAPSPLQALAGLLRGEQRLTETPGVAPEQLAARASQQTISQTPGLRQAAIAASGVAGAPGDIIIGLGAISAALGGPDFRLPIGSDDMAKSLGIQPASMSGLERILQTTAGAASPGVFLKAAESAGILPAAAEKLYKFMSAGVKGDLAMGAASAIGAWAGAQVAPEHPVLGRVIGGIAGPAALAGLHATISKGVQALGKPTVAKQDLQAAQQAVETTFSPLQQTLENTVLLPRGTAPGPRAVGATIIDEATAVAQQQAKAVPKQLGQEGVDLIESIGPNLDRMAALGKAKQFFQKEFFEKGRKSLGTLFDATEKVTGDAPVVNVTKFRQRAAEAVAESSATGQAVPRGTQAASRLGLGAEDLLNLLDEGSKTPLTDAQRTVAAKIATEGEEVAIPFWMARRIESGLSAAAYSGKPIGTVTQGKARRLLASLQDDLHDFYAGPEATAASPEIAQALQGVGETGSSLAEALPLAKQKYREFVETTNRTVISKLLDPNPVVQEKFLNTITSSSADQAHLLTIKNTASPEVWDTLGAYALGDLHRKASSSGQFDPRIMARELTRLRKSGKMEVLYTPEQVASIERYAASLTSQETGHLPALRAALTKKTPEQVIDYVFQPGDYTRTQNFKAIAQPETWDAAVKAWAAQMADDVSTLSPAQIRSKYGSMVQREKAAGGGISPSQLDIILTEYPDVADQITDAFTSLPTRQQAVEAATAQVERSKAGRSFGSALHGAGLASLLHGIYTGSVLSLGSGGAMLAAPGAGQRFAATETGRDMIRYGLTGTWGPSTARWVLHAIGSNDTTTAPMAPGTAPPAER